MRIKLKRLNQESQSVFFLFKCLQASTRHISILDQTSVGVCDLRNEFLKERIVLQTCLRPPSVPTLHMCPSMLAL